MGRRDLIKRLAAMVAAVEVGIDTVGVGAVEAQRAGGGIVLPALPDGAVIGIQMSPHTMLDEGIERCLGAAATARTIPPRLSRRRRDGPDRPARHRRRALLPSSPA